MFSHRDDPETTGAAATRQMGKCRRFVRNEEGASAAEFALVIPLFLIFLFGIMQYGLLFFTYNNMTNAAREAARALSVGELDEAGAEARATDLLVGWVTPSEVVAQNSATTGTDFVRVAVEVPGSDAGVANYAFVPMPESIVAEVFMREE